MVRKRNSEYLTPKLRHEIRNLIITSYESLDEFQKKDRRSEVCVAPDYY